MSTASANAALRYERKFVVTEGSVAEILHRIRRHPALFFEVYPSRTINNVYLDSPELRDYQDHVHGLANRRKTRVRWYGPTADVIPLPVLEQKYKRGLVSGKTSHRLSPIALNGRISAEVLRAGLDDVPETWRARLQYLRPTLLNRYQRRYYLSADRLFRLTVDSELEFYSPGRLDEFRLARRSPDPRIVLELKFDARHAERAEEVTNEFPFRITRCSKYVLGIEAL
jgi:hypothetical protein